MTCVSKDREGQLWNESLRVNSILFADKRVAITDNEPTATVPKTSRCCDDRLRPVSSLPQLQQSTTPGEAARVDGRVGACSDKAAIESFFSLLQKNVLNRRKWQTRDELRLAILTWIEKTYHRRRRQDVLGRLTPIEFETLLQTAHTA